MDWIPIVLSLKLAVITTLILFVLALPVLFWLHFSNSRLKAVVEAIVALPLVLPPTVIGFYLLLAYSPNSSIGAFLNNYLGLELAFSFPGLVIASVVYSFPFMIQPIQGGLKVLPKSYQETAFVLGKSKVVTFWKVLLPSVNRSILSAVVLSFAHTLGEFGVVLMIGGSIPNETKVASVAIYEAVEGMDYTVANSYSLVLIGIAFSILLFLYSRKNKNGGVFI